MGGGAINLLNLVLKPPGRASPRATTLQSLGAKPPEEGSLHEVSPADLLSYIVYVVPNAPKFRSGIQTQYNEAAEQNTRDIGVTAPEGGEIQGREADLGGSWRALSRSFSCFARRLRQLSKF